MKVKINGYEIEVKAKGYRSTRFNKQDTLKFLCSLFCDLVEARDRYEEHEYHGCADAVQNSMDNISAVLNENHYSAK